MVASASVVGRVAAAGDQRGALLVGLAQERGLVLQRAVLGGELVARLVERPLLGLDAGLHHRPALDCREGRQALGGGGALGGGVLPEPQRDLDQRGVVGAYVGEADEVGHHAVHDPHEIARPVAAGAEAALPKVDEQRVLVVGLPLGAQLGLGIGGLLLGLARHGAGLVAGGLGLLPCRHRLHLALRLGPERLHGRQRLLHELGRRVAGRPGARHLLEEGVAALGGAGDAQAVVVEDLHGAALAGIEAVDQPAGRHLVELHAGQLAQRLGTLLAQPLGLGHGRLQRAVQLALLAIELADRALDRPECLPPGPHGVLQRGQTPRLREKGSDPSPPP